MIQLQRSSANSRCAVFALAITVATIVMFASAVPARSADSAMDSYEEGLGHMTADRYVSAVKAFTAAIDKDPDESVLLDYYPHLQKGVALIQLGRLREAIDSLQESVRQGKSNDAAEFLALAQKHLKQSAAKYQQEGADDQQLAFSCNVTDGYTNCSVTEKSAEPQADDAELAAEKERLAKESARLAAEHKELVKLRDELREKAEKSTAQQEAKLRAEKERLAKESDRLVAQGKELARQRAALQNGPGSTGTQEEQAKLQAEKERLAKKSERLEAEQKELARQRTEMLAQARNVSTKEEAKLKAEKEQLEATRRELEMLAASLKAQQSNLQTERLEVARARNDGAVATVKYEKRKDLLDQRDQALAEQEAQLARERERLSTLQLSKEQIEGLRAQLSSRAATLDREKKELVAERQSVVAMKKDTERARQELDARQANLQKMEGELLQKQASLDGLQKRSAAARLAYETEIAKERQRTTERLQARLKDIQGQKRIALVIGNASYKSSPLKNAVHDAVDMASALASLGFEVDLRKDVDKRNMDEAIRKFSSSLKSGVNTVGLFYYAGHGVQLDGENFLVPIANAIENEVDLKYNAVPMGYVLDSVQLANSSMNVFILDACRDNPYRSRWRSVTRGLARVDGPKGSIIAYSTSPGSVSLDGDERNGIYTKFLLKALKEPNVPIELMFKKVRNGVEAATHGKQTPWESSSLKGDFYFSVK